MSTYYERMNMRWSVLGLLLLGLFVLGCGEAGGLGDVSGVVTMDGAPLDEGEIVFEAADQATTPAAAAIKVGKYQLHVSPGKKIVRISASRSNGVVDPLMKTEGQEPMIQPEFNSSSKLTAEVKSGSNPPLDFEVKSIPLAAPAGN